jgi:tRNA dimethylallyltransferase
MNKLVVIVGPTASGKSDLAIKLARQLDTEIISADSRQVYKGLDIGSGKVTKQEMKGVPHYLLDVANPKRVFTVSQYQKLAQKKIKEIWAKGKTPIIVGGTGLYIRAAVDGIVFPEVPPNLKLRQELEKKSVEELFKILKKLDQERANNIDAKNPRRLIRAIEIATVRGKVPSLSASPIINNQEVLFIGLNPTDEFLKKKIKLRLVKRLKAKGKNNLIAEIKKLRKSGLSWKRLEDLGLEYRYVALFLQGKITQAEMEELIVKESWQYAKRQYTWFKQDKRVNWLYNPKLYYQQSKNLCLKLLLSTAARS